MGKIIKSLNRVLGSVLTVNCLMDGKVVWAMSCDVTINSHQQGDNVKYVNFNTNRVQMRKVDSDPPGGKSHSVLEYRRKEKGPPNETGNTGNGNRSSHYEIHLKAAIEKVKWFIGYIEKYSYGRNFFSITQNKAWELNNTFINLKFIVGQMKMKPQGNVNPLITEFNSLVDQLKQKLVETQFFIRLHERGFSLIPKSHEKMLKPLSETFLDLLTQKEDKLIILLKGVEKLMVLKSNSILPGKFFPLIEDEFSISDLEVELARTLNEYLQDFNKYLSKVIAELNGQVTDLDRIINLVKKTKYMLLMDSVVDVRNLEHEISTGEFHNLMNELNKQVDLFHYYSRLLTTPIRRLFLVSDSPAVLTKLTISDIKEIEMDLNRAMLYNPIPLARSFFPEWKIIFFQISERVTNLDSLENYEVRRSLLDLVNWVLEKSRTFSRRIDSDKSITANEKRAKVALQAEAIRLKLILETSPQLLIPSK